MARTYRFDVFGCQMNAADADAIISLLQINHLSPCSLDQIPDFYFLITCSVRASAEKRPMARLKEFKNKKIKHPDTIVVVLGCMGQYYGKSLISQFPFVDYVLGTAHYSRIPDIINGQLPPGVYVDETDFSYLPMDLAPNQFSIFLPVIHGCSNFCAYCIVPYLRGREVSRDPQDVIDQIRRYPNLQEVVLLGQNVNAYGQDIGGISFARLIKKIIDETSVPWIRFLTSHPKDFGDDLIEVIATQKRVCHHVHLPLQSASDSVLKEMNRQYTIEQYSLVIEKLRNRISDLSLTTDIIVGFPGERDADFQATIQFIEAVRFDDAYMYKYNQREGTSVIHSGLMEISEEEKTRRLEELIRKQIIISKDQIRQYVGQIVPALFEKQSKKNEHEFFGKTAGYLNVISTGPAPPIGQIVNVHLLSAQGKVLKCALI